MLNSELNFKIARSVLLASFLVFSSSVYAAVPTIYNFGTVLTASPGYTAPNNFAGNPFAQLAATNNGGGIWEFLLTVNNNLFSSFGNGAFLGSMTFDFTPDPVPARPPTTFLGSNVPTLTNVVTTTSVTSTRGLGAPSFDSDFGTKLGNGSANRLSQDDWVRWQVSGLGSSSLTNMFVHVQGIGTQGYSAKYAPVVTPIPEPETYAMLLAGLGILGFTARRRKNNV